MTDGDVRSTATRNGTLTGLERQTQTQERVVLTEERSAELRAATAEDHTAERTPPATSGARGDPKEAEAQAKVGKVRARDTAEGTEATEGTGRRPLSLHEVEVCTPICSTGHCLVATIPPPPPHGLGRWAQRGQVGPFFFGCRVVADWEQVPHKHRC